MSDLFPAHHHNSLSLSHAHTDTNPKSIIDADNKKA